MDAVGGIRSRPKLAKSVNDGLAAKLGDENLGIEDYILIAGLKCVLQHCTVLAGGFKPFPFADEGICFLNEFAHNCDVLDLTPQN